jgi:nitrate/TMAO reductase-like tetraheme cytochrome c subunit
MRSLLSRVLHWKYLAVVVIGAIVLGIGTTAAGVTIVSGMELDNQFCGSCHTEPETTYLARFATSLTGTSSDSAAFHYRHSMSYLSPQVANIRCIDCHVGEGVIGRATVLSLAAFDALKYYTHTARQPAQVVFNVQNETCLKCHAQDVMKFADQPQKPFIIDNHFHYKYFQPDAPPVSCVSCHPSHMEGSELNKFQFNKITVPVCEACHRYEGHGPVKMQ